MEILLEDQVVATLRPATYTATVTVAHAMDGSNTSMEITIGSDARDAIMEWLKEHSASDGFLTILDVEGDVFSYRADTVLNVEIMRDQP